MFQPRSFCLEVFLFQKQETRLTEIFVGLSGLFQDQYPLLKIGVHMPLFSVLNYGHIDIHDEPSSLFFSFLYFSMSSIILSSRARACMCVWQETLPVQSSWRPRMTTYPISVSLLQYQSCMQLLLINTLPPSSWVLEVLKLNLNLHSQQHTLSLITDLVLS